MSEKPTTKERLLEAACGIFAEKGFRDATVAEICEVAEANIAAVNYHFGDKEKLYDEVWRCAFATAIEAYPIDGSLPENPELEDYLHSFAHALLHRIFSEGESGLFAKLLYREMASPTLALERIATEAIFPQSEFLVGAVRTALGEQVGEQQIRLCMNSIVAQCAFYNFSRPLRERVLGKKTMSEEEIGTIARHIACFSLGGLKEIQKVDPQISQMGTD
ncbi:MAG: CerR family C-terminal domain-containing protein [Verrucomicrobiota bacterium]